MTDEIVSVDEKSLALLVTALHDESSGREMSRDFVHDLREVAEPAAAAARASILSMGTSGLHHPEPSLRGAVADQTKVVVRLDEQHPSVGIRVSKTGMPRDFRNAPKRLQARRGWRHPVFGRDRWVSQRGKPGWFDDTIKAHEPAAERAAARVLEAMAERISVRTRG